MKLNPKIGVAITAAIGIVILIGFFSLNFDEKKPNPIFHVTLADSKMYKNGIFEDVFEVTEGTYRIRFVPNGDSPQTLTIKLNGKSFSFDESFILEGTLQETEISTYYTWDYLGEKSFFINQSQKMAISVDPHGNSLGPISISVYKGLHSYFDKN